jgi:hypothetical protein
MIRTVRLSLIAVLLVGLVTSCDFGAAGDAVDDFEVVVGLPPLSSVINLQALDASTGNTISSEVSVTFEGPGASSVVDIYSDPLAELNIQEGFANFALDSTRNPTSENPVQLTLRAQAEGYNATSVSVQVRQEGSVSRVIRLTPENPEQSSEGTAGSRTTVNTNENGETTSAVSTQTGSTSDEAEAAQGGASIPSGTSLQTADGDPLQGQVTTDLSVFDNSSEAQELMPAEAKTTENGRRQIRGAVRFQAADQDGRVASQFETGGGDTTSVNADLPALSAGSGTPTVTFVNPATGNSRTVELPASGSSRFSRASAKNQQDRTTFRFAGNKVIINSPSGTEQVNLSEFEGEFFAAVGIDPSNSCTPQGTLTVNNPDGQTGSISVRVSGEGFAVDTEVGIPGGQPSFQVSAASLFEGEIPDVGPTNLTVRTPDEQEVSTSINLCSGAASVTLPSPSNSRIDASIRVEVDCPDGERLPVSPPFDGYSVAYRPSGSSGAYQTVPKEDITINTTDDTLETVTGAVVPVSGVLPNTDYEFVGTFGGESSNQEVTMPSQDGGETTVTDQELRNECR